jgi:hypothetical protein
MSDAGDKQKVVVARAEGGCSSINPPTEPALGAGGYNLEPVWQKEFFDHVLRSSESYAGKWHYVVHNPVRAGLVKHPEDWKYHGEIGRLEIVE